MFLRDDVIAQPSLTLFTTNPAWVSFLVNIDDYDMVIFIAAVGLKSNVVRLAKNRIHRRNNCLLYTSDAADE